MSVDYWKFHRLCGQVETKFGGFRNLPLKRLDFSVLAGGKRLLDFGSGDSCVSGLCVEHKRLDPDESVDADYRDIVKARESCNGPHGKFDRVLANQVFEHIAFDDLLSTVADVSSMMTSGGVILSTVPNVCNWTKYISDVDHKTPLAFYHVGALYEMNDISAVDCYRYAKRHDELVRAETSDTLESKMIRSLRELFEIDPAGFVAVVGVKR